MCLPHGIRFNAFLRGTAYLCLSLLCMIIKCNYCTYKGAWFLPSTIFVIIIPTVMTHKLTVLLNSLFCINESMLFGDTFSLAKAPMSTVSFYSLAEYIKMVFSVFTEPPYRFCFLAMIRANVNCLPLKQERKNGNKVG